MLRGVRGIFSKRDGSERVAEVEWLESGDWLSQRPSHGEGAKCSHVCYKK